MTSSPYLLVLVFLITLISSISADGVTESSDIRQSSAQAVAPNAAPQIATSPHPFSRQIAAPSRIYRRSITPVPQTRAHRIYHH